MKVVPELIPTVYYLDGVSQIKRCDESAFPWGVAAAYWFIVRPLYGWDHALIGSSREQVREWKRGGLNSLYWCGSNWWIHTPKQFATAAEALIEWNEKIICEVTQ